MNRPAKFLALAIVLSEVYDFWRGWHHDKSILEGITIAIIGLAGWLLVGFIIWTFDGWPFSKKPNSK
jgi:hypothetical protein